ncbi:MAG: IscS subfamily cysteine desulfurase, partial [Bacillota bacterium]|nr:IscS subfamily cysteine desulfurase [Bacillota bacterium]
SRHDVGGQSFALRENCREEFAGMLGVDKRGIFFTSGGSESNFLAIEALLSPGKEKGNHIITGVAEHSSIHSSLKRLESEGYTITYLSLQSDGLLSINELIQSIRPDTALIAIQHINSEIGTIQPIDAIAKICKENNIYFHSDFVQSFGKIEHKHLNVHLDSFSFSGHKIYGPKGVGGVYINPSIRWKPFLPGSSHEKGLRPGTLNVPGIAAMTVAAQKATEELSVNIIKYRECRDLFLKSIQPIKQWSIIHEAPVEFQYPGIIGLRILGIEGQLLMLELNRLGYAISTGSACQSGMQSPSKTMIALGLEGKDAKEFFRISFGQNTDMEDVKKLGDSIVNLVRSIK